MERLPRGANIQRCKLMWEVALHLAADPKTPYFGNRDMNIAVGKGSGESFKPWLRMVTGAPNLAHAMARGEIEVSMMNPSGILTQAYRGTGMFAEPIPVRVIANYPSWDRFVYLMHPRTGITSIAQIKEKRYPLRLSTREDTNHSTRVLIDQTFGCYGFSMADIESWGGSLQINNSPGDQRRLTALREGTVDAVFDEGLAIWFEQGLAAGMRPIFPEPEVVKKLQDIGWRKVVMPAKLFPYLEMDCPSIDYSGWPMYGLASLPDEDAYKICAAIHARADEIDWENAFGWAPFTGMGPLAIESEATPRDVPMHPGAARWFRENGFKVE